MQKKLYYLDESEKNRILNLHEDRTRKQYLLKEQDIPIELRPLSNTLKGNIGFYTVGERPINEKIRNFCKTYNGTPTLDDETIKTIIYDMLDATTDHRRGVTFAGRGLDDDAIKIFKKKIQELKNIPNFCKAVNLNKDMNLEDGDILNMFDEINSDNIFREILTEIQKLLTPTKEPCVGWENYPCVTKSTNTKPIKLTNPSKYANTDVYKGGGYYWFYDGQRFNLTAKKYEYYYCDTSDETKSGLNPNPQCKTKMKNNPETTKKSPGLSTNTCEGIGRVLQGYESQFNDVLKSIGLDGGLTKDNVNKLYENIK